MDGIDEDKLQNGMKLNGLTLSTFLPTPSRQKIGLQTKFVHVFQNLYNARSMTGDNTRGENASSDLEVRGADDYSNRNNKVIEIE